MSQKVWSVFTAALVMAVSIRPSYAAADDHIVPLREIEGQVRIQAEQRANNLADIERVLSYPAAAQELAKRGVSVGQVHEAVATLTDSELARLADRARASEKDVQGGLIVGILALIGLVVVIIIVVAIVAEAAPPPAPGALASARHGRVKSGTAVPQIAPVHG